jgi:hypothetical protein
MLALMLAMVSPVDGMCARKASELDLAETKARIVFAQKLLIPVTEMPHGKGVKECVRFVFRVNRFGEPYDIKVAEDSNNFVMNLSGYRALVKYKFEPCNDEAAQFTLIFSAMVEGMPEAAPN